MAAMVVQSASPTHFTLAPSAEAVAECHGPTANLLLNTAPGSLALVPPALAGTTMSLTSTAMPGAVSLGTCLAGIDRDDRQSLCGPTFCLAMDISVDSCLETKPTSLMDRKSHDEAI
jgi:hypothetical protein